MIVQILKRASLTAVLLAGVVACGVQDTGIHHTPPPATENVFTGPLQKLSWGFSFTEGPTADSLGNVYFTDQPNNKIYCWSIKDSLSVFSTHSGRSNGLYFNKNGFLIGCADSSNSLWQFSPTGDSIKVLLNSFQGQEFNGPNDLWIDQTNGIYFTDPYYKRDYWTSNGNHGQMKDFQAVYYLPAGAKQAICVAKGFQKPNGIIGSNRDKLLYVADIDADTTWRFPILGPGKLGHREFFADMGSDGMTLDDHGNIYLTGNGVSVFNSQGDSIASLPIQEKWTANVCFGGRERNRLYITASNGLYAIVTSEKGQ